MTDDVASTNGHSVSYAEPKTALERAVEHAEASDRILAGHYATVSETSLMADVAQAHAQTGVLWLAIHERTRPR